MTDSPQDRPARKKPAVPSPSRREAIAFAMAAVAGGFVACGTVSVPILMAVVDGQMYDVRGEPISSPQPFDPTWPWFNIGGVVLPLLPIGVLAARYDQHYRGLIVAVALAIVFGAQLVWFGIPWLKGHI